MANKKDSKKASMISQPIILKVVQEERMET